MQRRAAQRFKRRLQLRFWSLEDKTPRNGFTQDISVTGMFICTNSPFRSKTRVAIEMPVGGDKIQLQGEVRHARRVDPVLRKVKNSGMGIRLLKVEEVMSEVLRLRKALTMVAEGGENPVGNAEPRALRASRAATVFPVSFASANELARSFNRDLRHGGLFVATPTPAERNERVRLEFRFDWDPDKRISVEAQVVKRFVAAEGSATGEQVTGMGVAFSDPAEVIARLSEILSSFRQV